MILSKKQFKEILDLNSDWSSYTCFANFIIGKKLGKTFIRRWFNKLVDKDDYLKEEKEEILNFLVTI